MQISPLRVENPRQIFDISVRKKRQVTKNFSMDKVRKMHLKKTTHLSAQFLGAVFEM